jgi:spermidine synthase
MDRKLGNFLLGACAFATAHAAQRMIAPFAGLGLTLHVAVLTASLIGFALGCILGAGSRPAERLSPLGGRILLGAAVLTLALTALRRPLLESLDHAELRLAVMAASALFTGLPCAGIGFAFAEGHADSRGADSMRGLAWLLAGAALAAPLSGYLLVPRLGLTVTLTVIAATEAVVALVSGARRASLPSTVGALLVLAAATGLAVRPAAAVKLGPQLLEHRFGAESEYRVFDREGARYLLADGSILAVIDTLSGDGVQRGASALELLKHIRSGRDSMLVLGLRGGALALSFARSGWRVRVVEPDSVAAAVSRRVSYRPGEIPLEIADPRRFVRADRSRYSVAVVDAFANSDLPWTLCTREFVADLAARVTEDGLVVVVVEAHGWGDPMLGALAATLRTQFAHVIALPTSEPQTALGTVLLFASHQPVPFRDEQLPDPTTYFQNPEALWVVQQQSHAWLNRYQPQPAGAHVLTDDHHPVDVWADRVNHAARAELHTFFGPHGGSW